MARMGYSVQEDSGPQGVKNVVTRDQFSLGVGSWESQPGKYSGGRGLRFLNRDLLAARQRIFRSYFFSFLFLNRSQRQKESFVREWLAVPGFRPFCLPLT